MNTEKNDPAHSPNTASKSSACKTAQKVNHSRPMTRMKKNVNKKLQGSLEIMRTTFLDVVPFPSCKKGTKSRNIILKTQDLQWVLQLLLFNSFFFIRVFVRLWFWSTLPWHQQICVKIHPARASMYTSYVPYLAYQLEKVTNPGHIAYIVLPFAETKQTVQGWNKRCLQTG